MKWCSRSMLGVIIGVINVATYFAFIVVLLYDMVARHMPLTKRTKFNSGITYLNLASVLFLLFLMTMFVTSGLLVVGIIKRRHKLMAPWLILSSIIFYINHLHFLFTLIFAMYYGTFMQVFSGGIVIFVFSVLILWFIYTLYKDIEKQNIIQPTQVY